MLDIFKPEQLVERRDKAGALSASEAERRAALLWPAGYVGGRVNVASRLSVQATPLLKPPPLPLPWELGTDKPRNWLEIVKHTSKCIGHACGHPADILVVDASELRGQLRFNAAAAPVATAHQFAPQLRDGGVQSVSIRNAEILQARADAAEGLLLHNDVDVLVFTLRITIVEVMRSHLATIGFPAAKATIDLANRLSSTEYADLFTFIKERPCPNHGSSRTRARDPNHDLSLCCPLVLNGQRSSLCREQTPE